MRPVRDDSGERIGWWIGERFVPDDGSDLTRRNAEIAALTEQTYRLGEKWMEEQSARASERDESRAEIAALRDVVSLQGSALREIRIRLHAAGRRPEECYEMSILDDTIAAVRRALEAAK